MNNHYQVDKQSFLYQKYQYSGKFTPNNLVFNANLQEFSQRIDYICNLQTAGKLSADESYKQIEALWERLKYSYQTLNIEKDTNL
ncbi:MULTISPECIES: hypothetical protein [Nostoc]|uniref:Isopropylmalate/homocitrate/citramalate synthase n=1 Tax=Nostoc paludosum FACHB-159 TaxID=2692908 RepID=A0ABR8KG16_9NOSO|nr:MULTISPECIES: hypothetical protein [Nostoc]MBD2680613.1 hypothetical protein [Nostoc sp. FACHB-857]MBD2737007.1 hypothetical protein [Nostoc paludosum FACHB-159]